MIATTRKEKILEAIASSGTIDFVPTTREELFLAHILDSSIQVPTPIKRLEKLYKMVADGDEIDFIPTLRLELFVAKAAGMEVPSIEPITQEEYFWFMIEGGSSGKNLLDMAEENIRLRYYINDSGVEASNNQNFYNTKFISVKPNTAYTLSASEPVYYLSFMEYDSNKSFLQRTLDGSSSEKHSSTTITTRADTAYILIGSNPNRVTMNMDEVTSINWMLNEGSTPLPYEPYTDGAIVEDTP